MFDRRLQRPRKQLEQLVAIVLNRVVDLQVLEEGKHVQRLRRKQLRLLGEPLDALDQLAQAKHRCGVRLHLRLQLAQELLRETKTAIPTSFSCFSCDCRFDLLPCCRMRLSSCAVRLSRL